MTLELLLAVGLAIVGIVLSALFSGTETGVYTLNRVRLAVRSGRNEGAARILRGEIEHPNRLLATLLIGNNIANYAGSFGVAAMLEYLALGEVMAVAINALVLTPVLFVFGETLPKDLFRTHTDHWTYRMARFLLVVRWIFTATLLLPLVRSIGVAAGAMLGSDEGQSVAARQRMSQLIKEGVGAGVLSEPQMALAERALLIRRRRIDREMVPWSRVVALSEEASPAERDELLRRTNYTRLPVVRRQGEVVGVVSTIDAVIDRKAPTRDLMYDRLDLPADITVPEALQRMRRQRRKFAIVVDERTGRARGIVTLKDLVEPFTGELGAW